MRILFIVQNYPPERGPVRYTSSVAGGLAARGHHVRVITALPHYPEGRPYPGHGRLIPRATVEGGVHVMRVPIVMASNTELGKRAIGMASFACTSIGPALFRERPDIVVASLPPVTTVFPGLLSAMYHRVPVILLLRDVEPKISFELRGMADSVWARAAIQAWSWLYQRASHIVVVHSSQVSALTEYGIRREQISTIRHGVDFASFDADARRGSGPKLPRRVGRLTALYAGTVGVAHDLTALIRAFAEPEVRALPVDLVVVGGGEQAPECRRIIRELQLDHVTLCPPVPHRDVAGLLVQADLLVSAYRTLSRQIAGMVGSKLYEYCAAGRPLLVYGRGAAADLVGEAGNGICVMPGIPRDLAEALRTFLENPDLAQAMGNRGRAYAEKHFSVHDQYDRWEVLLADVISRTVGPGRQTVRSSDGEMADDRYFSSSVVRS